MKFYSKAFALFALLFTTLIQSIPIYRWIGRKGDKFIVLFEDYATHHLQSNEIFHDQYQQDCNFAVPALQRLVANLSNNEYKSKFITNHPQDVQKNFSFYFNNPKFYMKDCTNIVCNYLVNTPVIKNVSFGSTSLEGIITLTVSFFESCKKSEYNISASLANIKFSDYIKKLKDSKEELSKYFAAQDFEESFKKSIFNKLDQLEKLIIAFENNSVIKFIQTLQPKKKKNIPLTVFLRVFYLISKMGKLSDYAYQGNLLAVEQFKTFFGLPSSFDVAKLEEFDLKFKEQKMSWLSIYNVNSEIYQIISLLSLIKETNESTKTNKLTICYLNSSSIDSIIQYMKMFFPTVEESQKFDIGFINDQMPVFDNLIANIASLESQAEVKCRAESVPAIDIKIAQERIDQIVAEIEQNHPYIKKSILDSNLTIEDVLLNSNIRFTSNKLTILMLAAMNQNSIELVKLLIELGLPISETVLPSVINQRDIPTLINFTALKFAETIGNQAVVTFLKNESEQIDNYTKPFDRSNSCYNCKKQGPTIKLSRCSLCKVAKYCSVKCQRENWEKHKPICAQIQKNLEYKKKLIERDSLYNQIRTIGIDKYLQNLETEQTIDQSGSKCFSCNLEQIKENIVKCQWCQKSYCTGSDTQKCIKKHKKKNCKVKKASKATATTTTVNVSTAIETSVSDAPPTTIVHEIEDSLQSSSEQISQEESKSEAEPLTSTASDKEEKKVKVLPDGIEKWQLPEFWDEKEIEDMKYVGDWNTASKKPLKGTKALALATPGIKELVTGKSPVQPLAKGSTGESTSEDTDEKLAMVVVRHNPQKGTILRTVMEDPRWPASAGWVKMKQINKINDKKIEIHYLWNSKTDKYDDFKFKSIIRSS